MRERQQSSTTRPIPFFLNLVGSTTGATGLVSGSTLAVTISKDCGAYAAPAGAITEMANGWYALAGNATDRSTLGSFLVHAVGTGCDPADAGFTIVGFDPFDGVRLGLTVLPNVAQGTAGSLPTGNASGAISGLSTQAKLDAENAVWEANINSHVSGSTFGLIPRPLYSANATGSSSTPPYNTITLDSGAMGTDGFYVGAVLVTYGNPGYGQARTITGYVGSTKVATVTPAWTTNVGSGTSFGIYPANTNFPPNQGLLSIDSSGRVILAPSGLDNIVVETGVNARQALSPIFAAAAGLVSGAGTGTIVIKAGNVPATTRITATTDASGNRSAVTLVIPT